MDECPWRTFPTAVSRAEKQLLRLVLSYSDDKLRTPDMFMSPCGMRFERTYKPNWVPLFPGATVLVQYIPYLAFSHKEVYIGRGHTITYSIIGQGVCLRPRLPHAHHRWYAIPCCRTATAARQCLRRAKASLGCIPFGFGSHLGTNCIAVSDYVAYARTYTSEARVARFMLASLFCALVAYIVFMYMIGR